MKQAYMLRLYLLCTLFVFLPVYSDDTLQIKLPLHEDLYSNYVYQLEKGDLEIDYHKFRFSFLESQQFVDCKAKIAETRQLNKILFKQMSDLDYEGVISTSAKLLSYDYTNMFAHRLRSISFSMQNDTINAMKHLDIQDGLLNSIIATGDGKTCDTGWVVTQVQEEYFILNMLGATLSQQSLVNGERVCDQMDVLIDGKEWTFFFNVEKIFEGYRKTLGN